MTRGGRAGAPRGPRSPCQIGRYRGPFTRTRPAHLPWRLRESAEREVAGPVPRQIMPAGGPQPARSRSDAESRLVMWHRRGPENGSAIESVRRCRGGRCSRELWRVTAHRTPHPRAVLHAAALSRIRSVSRETWVPCVRLQVCPSRAVVSGKPSSRPARRGTAHATLSPRALSSQASHRDPRKTG